MVTKKSATHLRFLWHSISGWTHPAMMTLEICQSATKIFKVEWVCNPFYYSTKAKQVGYIYKQLATLFQTFSTFKTFKFVLVHLQDAVGKWSSYWLVARFTMTSEALPCSVHIDNLFTAACSIQVGLMMAARSDINYMSSHQWIVFITTLFFCLSSTSLVATAAATAADRNSSLGDVPKETIFTHLQSAVRDIIFSEENTLNLVLSNCSSSSDIDLMCVNMTLSLGANLTLSASASTAKDRGWLLNEIQMIKAVVLVIVVSILLLSTCTFLFRTSSLFAKSKDDDPVWRHVTSREQRAWHRTSVCKHSARGGVLGSCLYSLYNTIGAVSRHCRWCI